MVGVGEDQTSLIAESTGYSPVQNASFMLSSSASLSMVCMVSRVIIMKGMLWEAAVEQEEKGNIFSHWGVPPLLPPPINTTHNKHFQAAMGRGRRL